MIGIVGDGTHSKRIQKILKKKKLSFFLYKPSKKDNYHHSQYYEELKKKKIIFILTPNSSHFKYINELAEGRYIFCEKPPVNSKQELKQLKKMNHKKIYFNFNTRFSKISEILSMRDSKFNLGNLIYSNILVTHGLALKKKEYLKSWRSKKSKCPTGVFETVSSHWIDLINYHFNIKEVEKLLLLNHSSIGNSFDTSHTQLKLANNGVANIFSTYCSPVTRKIIFIFKNGIVEQNENVLVVSGPALNFDNKNFLKKPKIIKKFYLNDKKDYETSLTKSVEFFTKKSLAGKNFEKNFFDCSIKTNSLLFK